MSALFSQSPRKILASTSLSKSTITLVTMKLLQFHTRNYALLIISYLQTWVPLTLAYSICNTPECNSLAQYYSNNLKYGVEPCNNFYEYACGGWINQHPKPFDKGTWNVHELMVQRTQNDIKKLLDDPQVSKVQEYELVKAIYRSCLKLPLMGKADAAVVRDIMSTVGNWPMLSANTQTNTNFNWQSIENQYLKIAGDSAFFKYYLTDTGENGFQMRLVIEQPSSPYGAVNRLTAWPNQNERNEYKYFLHRVIKSVAPFDTTAIVNVIDNELEKVINFREDLRNIIANTRMGYDTSSVEKLLLWYSALVPQQTPAQIDWLGLIRFMYKDSGDSYGNVVSFNTIVQIQPDYILKLGALLSKTPATVIANHIHLYFAERHTYLTYEMQVPLFNSFVTGKTGNLLVEPERWEVCLQGNNTAPNLRKMYIDAYFPPPVALSLSQLFEKTRQLLIQQIDKSVWPDPMLKQKWKETILNVHVQKGFPAWYLNHLQTVPKHSYDVDPIQPNVHYLRDINRISYSAAQFQWPFYNLYLPNVVRYGSVVPIIGHEFYHALDYKALLADIQNSRTSWAPSMYQQLQGRAQCFKDQYNYYRNEDIRNRGLQPGPVLAETTTEDIPDVMGLKLAYEMYKEQLQADNGQCTVLPGYDQVGCDKLFFISYANVFCASSDRNVDSKLMSYDVHSLAETRVNRAVSNNKDFAATFRCPQGSPLVMQNTCDLWQ